jgi:hypothetical protein
VAQGRGWLAGDIETVALQMRRLGIVELSDRQRRIVLGPEPLHPPPPPSSEQEEQTPEDPRADRFAHSGMAVSEDLRRMLIERAKR